ncbi:MAG TPA: anti-sigma F factor [Acholeplasmataceae bacterium]|jgi:stage II sporulation protein AB (anti-sigma F factor)|nr:anti-sigma F factor [Acholeplasmataceae bacterium]
MKNIVKMEFSAKLANVTFARASAAAFVLGLDLTINVINEIKTIVSEAVTNAIIHGYNQNEKKYVYLELCIDDNKLTIVVKDEGIGIENIEKAKEPLFTTKLQEERAGLGFTIMDIFSDEMEIQSSINEGTTVICTKILPL